MNRVFNQLFNQVSQFENIITVLLRFDKEASALDKKTQTQEWLNKGSAIEVLLTQVEKDFGTKIMINLFLRACDQKGGTINPLTPIIIQKLQTVGLVLQYSKAQDMAERERAAQEAFDSIMREEDEELARKPKKKVKKTKKTSRNMNVELLVTQVVTPFVNINNIGNCLLNSIILHELFSKHDIKSKIVKGYKHILKKEMGYLHFWVETENGKAYDVSNIINSKVLKKQGVTNLLEYFESINVQELPSNVERNDMETEEEKKKEKNLHRLYDVYLQDSSKYWSEIHSLSVQMIDLRYQILGTNTLK